jgi:hypothetical protein
MIPICECRPKLHNRMYVDRIEFGNVSVTRESTENFVIRANRVFRAAGPRGGSAIRAATKGVSMPRCASAKGHCYSPVAGSLGRSLIEVSRSFCSQASVSNPSDRLAYWITASMRR